MSFRQLVSDMGMVLWLTLPLFGANMLAVLTGRGGRPIDGGRTWRDGERLLGDGKTWQGFLFAPLLATCITIVLPILFSRFVDPRLFINSWADGRLGGFWLMLSLAYGAMVGDLVKSFFKRRARNPRGAAWPGWDQFDAILGGLGSCGLVCLLVGSTWFARNLIPGRWLAVASWLPLYWLLHRCFSILAHRRGLKSSAA